MGITKASNRYFVITPTVNGEILEIGPASTTKFGGSFVIQFNPDINFVGSVVILARLTGGGSEAANLPFLPVPYHKVTINNVASDYSYSGDTLTLTSATKIQVPSNMDSIGLLVACSAGSCPYWCVDVPGSDL